MSAFVSYFLLLITSGAIYLGVPLSIVCDCSEKLWIAISPKSAILTQSSFVSDFFNKIFAGFKSRWMRGGFFYVNNKPLRVFEWIFDSRYNTLLLSMVQCFSILKLR